MAGGNPDFWVAIATAAPVIGIAQLLVAERNARVFGRMWRRGRIWRSAWAALASTAISFGATLFMFLNALESLRRADRGPEVLAEIMSVLAFLTIASSSMFISIAEHHDEEDTRETQTVQSRSSALRGQGGSRTKR